MTTAAESAKKVRAALKSELGANRNKVSVTCSNFSMSSSLAVNIKDPSLDFAKVTEIAEREESISRCSITGDILGGGNHYVSVGYAEGALAAFANIIGDALDEHGRFHNEEHGITMQPASEGSQAKRMGAPWEVIHVPAGSKSGTVISQSGIYKPEGAAYVIAKRCGVIPNDPPPQPDLVEQREKLESEAEALVTAMEALKAPALEYGEANVALESIQKTYAEVQNKLSAL